MCLIWTGRTGHPCLAAFSGLPSLHYRPTTRPHRCRLIRDIRIPFVNSLLQVPDSRGCTRQARLVLGVALDGRVEVPQMRLMPLIQPHVGRSYVPMDKAVGMYVRQPTS